MLAGVRHCRLFSKRARTGSQTSCMVGKFSLWRTLQCCGCPVYVKLWCLRYRNTLVIAKSRVQPSHYLKIDRRLRCQVRKVGWHAHTAAQQSTMH